MLNNTIEWSFPAKTITINYKDITNNILTPYEKKEVTSLLTAAKNYQEKENVNEKFDALDILLDSAREPITKIESLMESIVWNGYVKYLLSPVLETFNVGLKDKLGENNDTQVASSFTLFFTDIFKPLTVSETKILAAAINYVFKVNDIPFVASITYEKENEAKLIIGKE